MNNRISLEEAAREYRISKRTLQRRVAANRMRPVDSGTSESGQGVNLYLVDDIRRLLPTGASRDATWRRFFYRCLAAGCAPKQTLEKLVFTQTQSRNQELFYDIDLAHAAMKLVMDGHPSFLHMLSDQWRLKRGFASKIAQLLGPDRRIRLSESDEDTYLVAAKNRFLGRPKNLRAGLR